MMNPVYLQKCGGRAAFSRRTHEELGRPKSLTVPASWSLSPLSSQAKARRWRLGCQAIVNVGDSQGTSKIFSPAQPETIDAISDGNRDNYNSQGLSWAFVRKRKVRPEQEGCTSKDMTEQALEQCVQSGCVRASFCVKYTESFRETIKVGSHTSNSLKMQVHTLAFDYGRLPAPQPVHKPLTTPYDRPYGIAAGCKHVARGLKPVLSLSRRKRSQVYVTQTLRLRTSNLLKIFYDERIHCCHLSNGYGTLGNSVYLFIYSDAYVAEGALLSGGYTK